MAEPTDMIMPTLIEMRAENAALHNQHSVRFDVLEHRLAAIEGKMTSFKHALTSDTLMSRLVTGEFEERIEVLEAKVRELEAAR